MGLGAVAAATVASGVIGAGASILGSSKAAGAAKDAAEMQERINIANNMRIAPYVQAGYDALPQLAGAQPGTLTQAQLEAVPGYQFVRDQGLKSTQSAAAARGLGVSGAALKGAASYATGLANQTYMNAFQQQQQKFQNLLNIATLGGNAATGVGTQSVASGQNIGNALQNAGTLQGSGIMNASNALNQGVQNYLGYSTLQSLINPSSGSGLGNFTTAGIGPTYGGGIGGGIVPGGNGAIVGG